MYRTRARHTPPPQDLSKSEGGPETGTHQNNPTIAKHRPDDSHANDMKIFYEKNDCIKFGCKTGVHQSYEK